MDIIFLLKSLTGLVVVLALLIFFLFYAPKKKLVQSKQKKKKHKEKKQGYESLESLVAIIRDKKSSAEELLRASELIIKYHGTIHEKLGMRAHPDFDIFGEILLRLCRHPHTNKKIILGFEGALSKKNPEYAKEINDFLSKGLNSRGF